MIKPGDHVTIREPDRWERAGVVVDVDHVDGTVSVRWGIDTPGGEREEWFPLRYVFLEHTEKAK